MQVPSTLKAVVERAFPLAQVPRSIRNYIGISAMNSLSDPCCSFLAQIGEALALLHQGEVIGKLAITCN